MVRFVDCRRILAVVIGVFFITSATTTVAQQPPGQQQEQFIELPDVSTPAARTDEGARDVAIIIAIEDYHNLTPVPGAEVTGLDWKEFFTGHLGMDDDRVLFIKNQEAMPSSIKRRMSAHLEKADEEGRVWFVFIGHGAPDPTEKDPEGLLVGVSALNHTPEDFRDGSLPRSEVDEMLSAGPQDQTIAVLDTCFSGQTEHGQSLTGTQAVVPDPSRLEPELGERDIVFSAAAHDEAASSLPGPTVNRPAFSYTLLGALRGWADTTGDGTVTPAEAERYVRRALVGMQTPSVTVEDEAVRRAALVKRAPEEDPGFSRTLQSLINRGKAYEKSDPCDTDGKVRNVDTQGNCCWPGQAYSSQQNSCVGTPMCPDGMVIGDDGDCREAGDDEAAYGQGIDDECNTPARCRQLGQDAFYGRGGERDYERAVELFTAACEGDDEKACGWLGVMYRGGRGVERDAQMAKQLFSKSCDKGDLHGCTRLGEIYGDDGDTVQPDAERAKKLHQRACEGGNVLGCSNLGEIYAEGRGVPQDPDRAFELFQRGCDGDELEACLNLAVMYAAGQEVEQDLEMVRELLEKMTRLDRGWGQNARVALFAQSLTFEFVARCEEGKESICATLIEWHEDDCDGDDMGETNMVCNAIAHSYRDGVGVAQDRSRSTELYKKSCVAGDARACDFLAGQHQEGQEGERDFRQVVEFFDKACDGGDMMGCYKLGDFYRQGQGVEQDFRQTVELFDKACDGGNMSGCNSLGYLYQHGEGVEQDHRRAFELFEKACTGDNMSGCWNLGYAFEHALGVDEDLERAAQLYQEACWGGESDACEMALEMACEGGESDACETLEELRE